MALPGRKMRAHCRGFSLSELLLAAAISVFVLACLLLLFINCAILNDSNRNLTIASAHAQYVMEDIRDAADTDFSLLESKVNNGDWDLDANEIQSAPYNLDPLKSETIDAGVTQSGNPLGIRVIVQWSDRMSRLRQTSLDTIIAGYK